MLFVFAGGVYVNLVRRQLMGGIPASRPADGRKGSMVDLRARQHVDEVDEDADEAPSDLPTESQAEEGPGHTLVRVFSS